MHFEELQTKNRIPRVLVIDDSRLNRAIVKKTLLTMKVDISEAADGREGLAILRTELFDLVLVDIIMPHLDGFEFIEKFKELMKDKFVPVILMTGTEDLNSKIRGLTIGADDFLLKPLNERELIARVNSLLRLKQTHDELYEKNRIIQRELAIAKRVQQFIIPSDFSHIASPRIHGRYLPIEDIGGDYFDCYRLENGNVGMLIADVTGHGIPAAMVMTMSKMIFSVYSEEYASPSMLLAKVNKDMRGLLLDYQYITAFYVIYNADRQELYFTNAGHTRPLYYRRRTDKVMALDTDGFFIGIMDETVYEERKLRVEPGDTLFLYTDGISEIKNADYEDYGENRLARFLRRNNGMPGKEFCDALLRDVGAFASLDERLDDIAFLYVEF